MISQLGPPLSSDVLRRRSELPDKPDPVVLTGGRIVLRPYDRGDAGELHEVTDGSPVERLGRKVGAYDADELVWRYIPDGPFADDAAYAAFQDGLAARTDARTFTAAERDTGRLVGSLSLLANRPADLKVEIGAVWYTPAVQGLGVNAEATNLLIDHAFALGYQRVEWKCHADNQRSRTAALRLGFRFEGIQERHQIVKDRFRDTAWFRLLATEWPRPPRPQPQ
jgi:RimJ/RimL family protein N-acetyltransferase